MARSSEEDIRRRRRRRLVRGLMIGGAALGVPAVINGILSRRAKRLPPPPRWGEPRIYPWAGGDVSYQELGQGDTLTLVHSFGAGHSGAQWRGVAEVLAESHRVLVPDLIGWGESSRPRQSYDGELYIQLLIDFLSEVAGERSVVLGAGLPASYVVQAAVDHPELVSALALLAPQGIDLHRDEPDLKDGIMHRLLRLPILGTSAMNVFASHRGIESHLREAFYDTALVTSDLLEQHYRLAHLPGAQVALAAFVSGYLNHGIRDILSRVEQPTLLIWGRQAESPSLSRADLWLRELPDSRLEVIEECGILAHVERPDATAAMIGDFLPSTK